MMKTNAGTFEISELVLMRLLRLPPGARLWSVDRVANTPATWRFVVEHATFPETPEGAIPEKIDITSTPAYRVLFLSNGGIIAEPAQIPVADLGRLQLYNGYAPYPYAFGGAAIHVEAATPFEATQAATTILRNALMNTSQRPSRGLLENFAEAALEAWGYTEG